MTSFVPIAMLVITFFLIGGVISFWNQKQWFGVAVTVIGAVLAGTAAWLWW